MRELFYRVLCASIWHRELTFSDDDLLLTDALLDEASRQGVLGLVSEALLRNNIRIGKERVARLLTIMRQLRLRHERHNRAIESFTRFMQHEGIPLLIVKGQTFAPLYPCPESRQVGDIDFYCGPSHFVAARNAIAHQTRILFPDALPAKHEEFRYKGIDYELHRTLSLFSYPPHQHYFDQLIEGEFPHLSPAANLLHQTAHIYYHIIKEGIGIRQFCDMVLYLHHHHDETDFSLLERHLRQVGLYHPFCAMGYILTSRLDLPTHEFPYPICRQDIRWAKKIMEDLDRGGNFGKALVTRHGCQRNVLIFRHYLRYVFLTPKEILCVPFEKFILRRWRRQTS